MRLHIHENFRSQRGQVPPLAPLCLCPWLTLMLSFSQNFMVSFPSNDFETSSKKSIRKCLNFIWNWSKQVVTWNSIIKKKKKKLLSYLLKSLKPFLKLFLGNAMVVRFFKQLGMGLAKLLLARFDTPRKESWHICRDVWPLNTFDLSFRIEELSFVHFRVVWLLGNDYHLY